MLPDYSTQDFFGYKAAIAGSVFLYEFQSLRCDTKENSLLAYAAVQMILVFFAAYGMGITLLFASR